MGEGENREKPGMTPVRYKGYEIFLLGVGEGTTSHGTYEIWKGDDFICAGKADEPSGRVDYATNSAERAATEWIDAQEDTQ